jgi:putative acetyltransferase
MRANVDIRPYAPEDLDAAIEVFLRAIRETCAAHYDARQIAAWAQADRAEWSARRLAKPTWVAVSAGTIAGFADLEWDGHLDMMFVHPAHQRAGVATALLRQIERAAHEQGIARIHTDASITARPFFERHGFRVVSAQSVSVRGQSFANFRMEKHLTAQTTLAP